MTAAVLLCALLAAVGAEAGRPCPELERAKLPLGSKLLKGSCVTPDGKYAYLVHTIGRFWLPVTMVERGWCHNAAMSVFDGASGKYLNTVLLDDANLGAAEPWDVIADERTIAVAHSGSSELSLIDRAAFERRFEERRGEDLSTDMTFMSGIRRRVPTPKQGPRKIEFRDGTVVVTAYFEDERGVTAGELAFNDARRGHQQWQSCGTCHPGGGSDGLTWAFPVRGGIGKAVRTRDLHKSVRPPEQLLKDVLADFGADLFMQPDPVVAPGIVDYIVSLRKPWYRFW